MDSLMEQLASQLGGDSVRQISRQLGVDERTAGSAISGALPMLFGALARNSSSSTGASALAGALDRDHDGSILDDLGGFLNSGGASQGSGILKHVLGGRRSNVESAVANASGLDAGNAAQLLKILAPVVMGFLGKQQRSQRLDPGGLASMLGGEQRRAERARPEMGALGSLLDQDGDGDVMDDVAKAGAGLLGRFLGGR